MCICVWTCPCKCEFSQRPEALNSSESELQVAAGYLMRVLGTKFRSFAKTVHTLKL